MKADAREGGPSQGGRPDGLEPAIFAMVALAGRCFCFKLEERVPLMALDRFFAEPGVSGPGSAA